LDSEILNISGFGLDVVGRDINLHVDGIGNATTSRLDRIGFIREITVERGDAVQPRIA
jgi:hypothetical protein